MSQAGTMGLRKVTSLTPGHAAGESKLGFDFGLLCSEAPGLQAGEQAEKPSSTTEAEHSIGQVQERGELF